MMSTTSVRASCFALMSVVRGRPADEFNVAVREICPAVARRQSDAGSALPEARLAAVPGPPEHFVQEPAVAVDVIGKLITVGRLQRGAELHIFCCLDSLLFRALDHVHVCRKAKGQLTHLPRS